MKYQVDIPGGWAKGWPRIWDTDVVPYVQDFLHQNGIDPKDPDCQWIRIWPVGDEDAS